MAMTKIGATMKVRTHYNRIDRVVYEFDEADIREALIAYARIKREPGKRIEFETSEDDGYKTVATITIVWETLREEQPNE